MSAKIIGRVVGALFLLGFLSYIPGEALIGSASGAADPLSGVIGGQVQLAAGALAMLVNSVAVVGVGVLAASVMRPHHPVAANAYLIGRTVEAVMFAVGVVFLLLLIPLAQQYADTGADAVFPALAQVAKQGNHYAYQIGSISLCVAGLIFCHVLLRARLAPAFMAVWGLAGYAVLLAGTIAEILGYSAGLVPSIPGGLFEIALGILLLVKGFPAVRTPDGDGPGRPSVASGNG